MDDQTRKKYLKRLFESAKVDISRCWLFNRAIAGGGYGSLSINGKTKSAHRAIYELMFRKLTRDEFVMHQCDNKVCINPFHLAVGCSSQNMKEAYARGIKKPTRKKVK